MPKWIQVEIKTSTQGIEAVSAVLLEMGLGYAVQDPVDFQNFLDKKYSHWDYIDDEVLKLQNANTIVTVYLSDKKQGIDQLAVITRELDRLKFIANDNEWGELSYELSGVDEEDWANSWKQYYKPVQISNRLTICPKWQEYEPEAGEIVLRMDPGMAFGTGTHESTKLCLTFLSEISKGGEKVLDIGCGSGILSIAAVMLGAESGIGTDIDQVSVEVAEENAAFNKLSQKLSYIKGSFADQISGTFDIVFANIVADAIISFADQVGSFLSTNGVFICSGIIDQRADEVEAELKKAGLIIKEKREDKGWVAFLCQGE